MDFIRRNAKAGKPFFVEYWPNLLTLIKAYPKKKTQAGTMVSEEMQALDAFVGELMKELRTLGIAENTLVVAMADNGPMVHSPPPQFGMLSLMYRGGKGDFLEGGVRVPAFASRPGMIDKGQTVVDIVHVTDLFTTFARLAGATNNIPSDRVIDGIDQTSLLLNGDTHSRRDYVFIYAGHSLGATVKGRYKRHWLGAGEAAASGMPEAYYDLYTDSGHLVLCAESALGRSFHLERSGEVIATVSPDHAFTRRASIEILAERWDFPTISFSFWLVVLTWRRAANNSGGGD